MASPRLTISTSSPDACRNRPAVELSASVESIELKQIGDTSEGPHHHTVEISIGRKGSYMTKILFSACLVTLIAGGVLITTIRDWDYVGLGGGVVNKNWGASVSVDPWDDDNDSDLMTAQVGKVWKIPYRAPTLFVQRETIYDKIFPYFSFQHEVFGVALMPPEAIVVNRRNMTISNSTMVGREKRFVATLTFLIILWSTVSAVAAATVSAGLAYSVTRDSYDKLTVLGLRLCVAPLHRHRQTLETCCGEGRWSSRPSLPSWQGESSNLYPKTTKDTTTDD